MSYFEYRVWARMKFDGLHTAKEIAEVLGWSVRSVQSAMLLLELKKHIVCVSRWNYNLIGG